jgi:hypothetical protein
LQRILGNKSGSMGVSTQMRRFLFRQPATANS